MERRLRCFVSSVSRLTSIVTKLRADGWPWMRRSKIRSFGFWTEKIVDYKCYCTIECIVESRGPEDSSRRTVTTSFIPDKGRCCRFLLSCASPSLSITYPYCQKHPHWHFASFPRWQSDSYLRPFSLPPSPIHATARPRSLTFPMVTYASTNPWS